MRTDGVQQMPDVIRGRLISVVVISSVFLGAVLPCWAGDTAGPLAKVDAQSGVIVVQPSIQYEHVRLTVTGPDEFVVVQTFTVGETVRVELPGVDGLYKYELRFSPLLDARTRAALAAAREDRNQPIEADLVPAQATVQAGAFTIAGGSVVLSTTESDEKVVLTNGDGVIRNSLCVGFDCPDAPVFDDSTILMMENNTRIKFGDTSNSPFPNNDWEIQANSDLSGGASYLGFNDCGTADNDGGCAADLVFAVESGARASALYVESDGDVGIGTSNPVVDIHMVTGNTPTLRLDQDGSSGFAPQVWDIAGNETNFFIRDVTGGSRLPLRVRPGAPTSSIDISAAGDVGIGISSPSAAIDVVRSTGAAATMVRLANDNAVKWVFENTGTGEMWINRINNATGSSAAFFINQEDGATDPDEFKLDANGNLTILGTLTQNSDRNRKDNIRQVEPMAVLEKVNQVPISTWTYKEDHSVTHLGPMAQDFHAAFGLGTDGTSIATIDTSGVALASIQALYRMVLEQNAELERRVRELEEALAQR